MLRERGADVVALVRSPNRAADLANQGVELVEGDVSGRAAIAAAMRGCDAAIHGAAIYEVGVPRSRHEAMHAANVDGTVNVLGAALDAGVGRVVYISTIAAFGNTHGKVVDESYQHPGSDFTSYYEETKYEAHQVAKRLIAEGLPCVMVQPGGVYGPKDHSALGKQISDFVRGRLPLVPFADLGLNMVHVEDVAAGVLAALDRGEVLRTRRRNHDDGRTDGIGCGGHRQAPAARQAPDIPDQGDRPAWTRGRPPDGPAAEHARARFLV
jgi:dihydroflavonol-4-reductase